MAGGRFWTTCTPKYSEIYKVVAPFGTTLDCDMWRGALGTRQMAQSRSDAEILHIRLQFGALCRVTPYKYLYITKNGIIQITICLNCPGGMPSGNSESAQDIIPFHLYSVDHETKETRSFVTPCRAVRTGVRAPKGPHPCFRESLQFDFREILILKAVKLVMNLPNEEHSFNLQKTIGVLGIIFLLAGFWLYASASILLKGPGPYYRDYDPEMAYLLNSLAPFKGAPFFYTDHPGTPVEMTGTMLLGIIYVFFTDHANFIDYLLEHPEYFLNLAHGFITLLSVLCAIYFFLTVFSRLQKPNVCLALSLALLFYGLHPYSFKTLTVWSHTSFNFPLGAGYLILLFRVAHDAQGQISNRLAAGLGLALGVMMAVMINFVPWLMTTLVFIFLSNHIKKISWKKSLMTGSIVVLSCAAGFLVSILPSIHRMPYFFGFIYNLFSHQLLYGTGPEGIPSISLLWSNLHDMVVNAPLVFLAMLASLLISLFIFLRRDRRIREHSSLWALDVSLLLQCGTITLAVLKHPGNHYLLSLAATLPVLSLVILKLSDFHWRFSRQFGNALIIFSIISISAFALLSIKNRQAELLEARAVEAEINRVITEQEIRLNKKPGELLILRTNETYSYCSALLHGDFFTAGVFATEINGLCPSQVYFINRFDWVLYHGTPVAFHDLPWDILVARTWALAGNPSWKKEKIVEYPHNIYLVINEK